MEYTEDEIQHILKLYKQTKDKRRAYYDKIKDTEEFKTKNRAKAKEHYHENKELKKNAYIQNKELIKARSSYNYYKKRDRIDDFKEKYPDRYEKLVHVNYISEATEVSEESVQSP
jgi:hypothetical protein